MAVSDNHLIDMMEFYRDELEGSKIDFVVFGHLGDNHLHINLLPDVNQLEKAHDLYKVLVNRILEWKGTVSAEHGVGKLKKKYKMGIVTSSRKEHFDIIHKRSNILKYFDFVITSDDFINSKPNPEPYLIGINSTGYKASSCFAIEDSERGVISAKKAGLFCFAIPNDMTINGNFSKADIILDNLNDIFFHLD